MLPWIACTAFVCLALGLVGLGGIVPSALMSDGSFMLAAAVAAMAMICALEAHATE